MWRKIVVGFVVLLGSLGVLYLILRLTNEPVPPHPFFDSFPDDRTLNIAHQGGEQVWPSNTMFAFAEAVSLGVDVLEMDAHETADGVLILMHDDTVDRTTDGSGAIKDMSLDDILALDAGHYWTDDGGQTHPFRGQGITPAVLADVFTTYPEMPLNIEIKPNDPAASTALCTLIEAHEMTDKVLVGSFHDEALQAFRLACPAVATSMTESEIQPFWILNSLGLSALYRAPAESFQVPRTGNLPILGEVDVLTERFIENANRLNVEVHAWTINETAEMERLQGLGVNGIITDRPDRMHSIQGGE